MEKLSNLFVNIGDYVGHDVANDVVDAAGDEVLDDPDNVGDGVEDLKFISSIERRTTLKFNPE
jgi:hypothetical protein